MLRLIRQIGFVTSALLCTLTARADSWVAQYTKARAEVERVCARHELVACRQEILKLEGLLDGRQDVIHKLARLEAERRPGAEWKAFRSVRFRWQPHAAGCGDDRCWQGYWRLGGVAHSRRAGGIGLDPDRADVPLTGISAAPRSDG